MHGGPYFAHESCGFCTPCRVGTSALARMMDKIADGHGSPYELLPLSPAPEASVFTHALAPGALLAVFERGRRAAAILDARDPRLFFRAGRTAECVRA